MSEGIVAPDEDDIDRIARQLIHAAALVSDAVGASLCGDLTDLPRLQGALDSGRFGPTDTYALQSLGLAFGKVFVNEHPEFDWWMVDDEHGRDPAIRFRTTTLLMFPLTVLSKRVERGEPVDVGALFAQVSAGLQRIVSENPDLD